MRPETLVDPNNRHMNTTETFLLNFYSYVFISIIT